MGPAKRRQEVVECGFIGDIHGGQLQCCFQFLSMKQVICADTNVEQVAVCNAGRIVVRIICAWRRKNQPRRPVIRRTGADSVDDGGDLISTKKAYIRLLSRRESESIGKISYRTGDFTAIKAPGEGSPRAILFVLIPQKRRLLKSLIVIDAKSTVI